MENLISKVAKETLRLSFHYTVEDFKQGNKLARRWYRWDWNMGVAFYGIWKAYEREVEEVYLKDMTRWINERMDGLEDVCVNTCAPLASILLLHEKESNDAYSKLMNTFTEYLFNDAPRVPNGAIAHTVIGDELIGEIWADTLFMSVIYLAHQWRITGEERYRIEAITQLEKHVSSLFDEETGLFFHGFNDITKEALGVRWGRGNAWVTASIVEILSVVQASKEEAKDILGYLYQQLEALQKHQHDSGMWSTVIDEESTYEETSVTAGVAYGIYKGVSEGMVDTKFIPMADQAIEALVHNIDEDGKVMKGSSGTPIKEDVQAYNAIPYAVTPFTQGLTMMALCAKAAYDKGRGE